MNNDVVELNKIAEKLSELFSHISVRYDEAIPYLLALGKQIHTLDLRRKNVFWELELWRGSSNNKNIISEEIYVSFEEACSHAEIWLSNDDI
jgi:hypothetical protein